MGLAPRGFDADGGGSGRESYGRTKTEVRDKLQKLKEKLEAEHDNGPEASPPPEVAVRECAETWLTEGLDASAQTVPALARDSQRPGQPLTGVGTDPCSMLTASFAKRPSRRTSGPYQEGIKAASSMILSRGPFRASRATRAHARQTQSRNPGKIN